ncbi:glutamine synthetase [Hyphomicrobium methylovorum]|uniref:glutamine synthetase family protein n=1 Tax=Hyphomicrobium methylovorum TaxID=84 RepID=UPI0015E7BCCB|nr:glutamine synthetase family protein [Hyphomicrobium methylovorum]MBA2127671.1 glutamine synthetase [Hyphomicrobium methylovorum]
MTASFGAPPSEDGEFGVGTTPESLRHWLRQHRIEEIDCAIPDIAGVARGKTMPAEKFVKLDAVHLPISIFHQTITGDYVGFEEDGQQLYAESDLMMVPDLSTIRPAPWASSPTAQVIHDARWQSGAPVEIAPRNVLKHITELYDKEGWRPVVAPEIEFYLTKTNPDPDYPLEPPMGRSGRPGAGRQAYSLGAVDEYDKIVDDIYEFAERQYLKIDTIIHEGGAAQLEINLLHGDPVDLADQVFLFKRTIREAAFTHGCYATFMAKPLANEPGSAMHIHQSIVDAKTGQNIFTLESGEPSPLFFNFIAGQQTCLPAAMCLIAPYVNSYRRLVPNSAAPINVEWGYDNRSAGLRVPISPPAARRVETRLAGADSNPYLAIAASLACGYIGMKSALEPRPAVVGNAYQNRRQLPRGLLEALTEFEHSSPLHDILGQRFCHVYLALKRSEFEEFMRVISPWEREHLLLSV